MVVSDYNDMVRGRFAFMSHAIRLRTRIKSGMHEGCGQHMFWLGLRLVRSPWQVEMRVYIQVFFTCPFWDGGLKQLLILQLMVVVLLSSEFQ